MKSPVRQRSMAVQSTLGGKGPADFPDSPFTELDSGLAYCSSSFKYQCDVFRTSAQFGYRIESDDKLFYYL